MSPEPGARVVADIARIARALESADEAPARLRRVLELLHRIVPSERWAILAREADNVDPRLTAFPDPTPVEQGALSAKMDRLLRLVAGEGAEPPAQPSDGHHLALPLVAAGKVLGLLLVERSIEVGAADDRTLELCTVVAAQLGAYLSTLRVHRAAQEQTHAEMLRERMIGIVGHDLRSPISAISMSIVSMLKRGQLNMADTRSASTIARSADRMERIIQQLLDFTRARLGGGIRLNRESADLEEVCSQVVEEQALAHPQRVLHFQASGSCTGTWDWPRLADVIANLVSNALKHGDEGARVDVELRGLADEVVLSVHNAGDPIPEAFLPYLFDPFRRAQDKRDSLGLGLYIAKAIASAHGGSLDVRSTAREGTTFTLRLPRAGR